MTSARIPEEDAYYHAMYIMCFLTRSKENPGIDARMMRLSLLQRPYICISFGLVSDVTVVLGMRQSICDPIQQKGHDVYF